MHSANTALIYANNFLTASQFHGQIESFVQFLRGLAAGVDGELVLTSIIGSQIKNWTFSVGDHDSMVARAIEEARKTQAMSILAPMSYGVVLPKTTSAASLTISLQC